MVRFDEIDAKIFELIKEKKELTTSQLAKEIFKPKDRWEYRKYDSLIRKRLKKWNDAGLVKKIEKGDKSCYKFPLRKIFIGEAKLHIESEKEKVNLKLGKCVLLNLKDKWVLFKI